ncbi:centromere protein H (CENP-H)-domain-containing protein [Fusarium redolens]|uniref:Centromere protein H (CENP-H)-domain-containing protein n=1 Tax=Fusarium redolens TaxID=48865 RepID=A0A9P9KWE9_FUSRE|nr:centromere protein H (CENP-H)-domain-containing protein [Fusarium redolens]KAH7269807.1 centromere protein H (CENP-H)-domain-containing protein [Fusarium redolens]
MADSNDVPMVDSHEEISHLPISEDEAKILELYDRIQKLRLEIAIINAQKSHQLEESSSLTAEETQKAQSELMESRAQYILRNDVTEAVMTANPILKAVYGGPEAALVERKLLPYIERRDDTSISVATQAAETNKVLSALTTVQSNTLRKSRENVTSAAELLELAEQARLKKRMPPNSKMMQEQEELEAEAKASKQRWRVMKGVASGIIVGSGIDWVHDDELQDVVLDPEEEE